MEARINYLIRGIFMLDEKIIPPTLNKHLTNKIFNKPNKEAMEQVLYYLLSLTEPNCLKTVPWPITTFKEAAEFRNAATLIINSLNGFVYEKSSNVVGKVNSSLLANPGGPIFIFFMYQLCIYILYCKLKKKSIDVLNSPQYIEDEYIDNKLSMFNRISKSNFNEVNEIISQVDTALKNTAELAIKWKEIIQDSKQYIKDLKSELLNIVHCDATENEVVELKEKYINLYDNFEQKKLIAINCARLTDIILKSPDICDANIIDLIFNTNKKEFIADDGKVDLVKLLTVVKYTLNGYINWCKQLSDKNEIYDKIFDAQQLVNDLSEQTQCYEKLMKTQNSVIDNLRIENQVLEKEVLSNKNLRNIDPRIHTVYKGIPSIFLKSDFTDKPKLITSEDRKNSRRSMLLHCSSEPYNYQTLSFDEIIEVYWATLPNQNEIGAQNVINENNEHLSTLDESNPEVHTTLLQKRDDGNLLDKNFATLENPPIGTTYLEEMDKNDVFSEAQIKEDEVKSFSISRKSIENIKQKFKRIKKQAQGMSTIPHSPQSPF